MNVEHQDILGPDTLAALGGPSRPDIPSVITCTPSQVASLQRLSLDTIPRGAPKTRSNRTLRWWAAQMANAERCGIRLDFTWAGVLAKFSPERLEDTPDVETMLWPYISLDREAMWVSEVEVTHGELISRWSEHVLIAMEIMDLDSEDHGQRAHRCRVVASPAAGAPTPVSH